MKIQSLFFLELKKMIDSHCHLNLDIFKKKFSKIIDKAKKNNITSILTINTKIEDFHEHYNLIKDYKSIYISCGVHPEYIQANSIPTANELKSFCSFEKVIAIGETGIDLYYSDKNKRSQYSSFENHIECSLETNLPLIIHQRNSENEIIEVLKDYQKNKPLKVVFHCFTGTKKLRDFCIDNNYYISLSGIITFKNAYKLREVIKTIPLGLILIETDSPYLTPSPYRGIRPNEPFYVYYIGEYLAQFFNISIEEFEKITDNNFYSLFNKAIRYKEISYES